ncbi:hypothetical protein SAMN05421747_10278 [Parapedobacter composti]|uniref:Uncharacterized protein n=2 Tax=Parapedobacter TaxID=416949 RepID=A0A1T5BUR8_9SPHI|nr:hypothetical protein SAMN05421747_10278 [Parapedobacter composti]SKB50723.1 hypothetical protein SAMN05660226_01755 [Parapedobacter luteus]
MCACSYQCNEPYGVLLLPNQQPIGLDMAFPKPFVLTRQFVRFVFLRECTFFNQLGNDFIEKSHIQTALFCEFNISFELSRLFKLIHYE